MEPQKETPEEIITTHTTVTEPSKKFVLTTPMAILTGFALLALAIILVVPGLKKDAEQQQATPDTTTAPETPTSVDAEVVTLRSTDHVKGDAAAAEVLLFTYSDSDCPFCAKFHPTVASVLTDYKGKVAWVYRQFPLDMHPNA